MKPRNHKYCICKMPSYNRIESHQNKRLLNQYHTGPPLNFCFGFAAPSLSGRKRCCKFSIGLCEFGNAPRIVPWCSYTTGERDALAMPSGTSRAFVNRERFPCRGKSINFFMLVLSGQPPDLNTVKWGYHYAMFMSKLKPIDTKF